LLTRVLKTDPNMNCCGLQQCRTAIDHDRLTRDEL